MSRARAGAVVAVLGRAFDTSPALAVALAARAALAAVLAWLIVIPFGGVADEYAYYAPFGAVVAVSTTVMGSLRTSVGVFLALGIGGGLGVLVQLLGLPSPLAVGLVVGIGTLVAPLRWLGAMGSWAPVSALFVLILGAGHPEQFMMGYLGLTTLGALVGAGVNLVFPPLHVVETERAQDALRTALVEHLDGLADALEQDALPDRDWLHDSPGALRRHGHAVEELVAQTLGGPPVNWRLLRWQHRAGRLEERGRALATLALLVGELADTLARQVGRDAVGAPWGSRLDAPTARALRATAAALGADDEEEAAELLSAACAATGELAAAVRAPEHVGSDDLFAAASLVMGLRRALDTISPVPR